MVGILVHGNSHFILSGPLPDEAMALALVRYWSIIQIGEVKPSSFGQWQIKSKEFRENLEWAVVDWFCLDAHGSEPRTMTLL